MKKLLITGFEPFGGEKINPSMDAVLSLPPQIGDYRLIKLVLPVVFGKAAELAIRSASEHAPDVILCVGQAGGRSAITPEIVGINLKNATIPDNENNLPTDEPIIKNGSTAYFSTLPVRKLANALKNAGIPSYVSYSAGAYVCNDLLYSLLAHFDGSSTKVGFVHIPYSDDQQKQPSMNITEIVRGLTVMIDALDL